MRKLTNTLIKNVLFQITKTNILMKPFVKSQNTAIEKEPEAK